MARLVATSGGNRGNTYPLKDVVVLGRHEECDVIIFDRRASRKHARLEKVGEHYFVEDLGSRNGTLVNDQPVSRQILKDGDEITICDTRFVFREDAPAPAGLRPAAGLQAALKRSMVTMLPDDVAGSSAPSMNAVLDAEGPAIAAPSAVNATEAVERARKSLRTIWTVANSLVSIHDLQELLEEVMNQLFQIFPQADRGFVMLKEEGTEDLRARVIRSRAARPGEAVEIRISSAVVNEIMTKRKAVLSSDALSDERFSDRLSIVNFQIRSMMAAPLIVRGDILGLIHIDTTSRSQGFTEQDLELLTSIAPQVAIAIRNAQLVKQVEREAERRSGLQRYLSPDLVDLIMRGELDLNVGGRSCRGTAFFSDIIGFTRMSENLPPSEVVDRLNRYFHVMEEIIFRRGGTIDKFGGDSIMAFWGVLVEKESPSLEAVAAAVEMQNALFAFNLALGGDLARNPLRMGIGLNTGDLVAGNIGSSSQKIEFTVIGDSVNLASRIESKAGRGQVFVGESTYREVARHVAAVQLPEVDVKGKTGTVRIYSIRALSPPGPGEGVLVTVPVSVNLGGETADGLVVWAKAEGSGLLVELCSARTPQAGSSVTLRPLVQEKPALGELRGRVVAARDTRGPGSALVEVESPPAEFVQLITPGNVCRADISAAQVVRE